MKTLKILLAAVGLGLAALLAGPLACQQGGEEPKKQENQKAAPAVPTGGGDGHRLIWVSAAALSPDGKQLLMGYHIVSSSLRGIDLATVKWLTLWDVETGKEIKGLFGHKDQLVYAAFLPDGKRAVSVSQEGLVMVWDMESKEKLLSFDTGEKYLCYASLDFDGAAIYTYHNIEKIKFWDAKSGKLLRTLKGPKGRSSFDLKLSKNGNYGIFKLPPLTDDGAFMIWDMKEDRKIDSFKPSRDSGDGCAFAPDGKAVIISRLEGYLTLYDLATFKEIRRFEKWPLNEGEPLYRMYALFSSPDGKGVFSYPENGMFRRWDVASGKEVWAAKAQWINVGSLAFSQNGKIMICASGIAKDYLNYRDEVDIRIWDLETGKVLRTLPSPKIP